MTRCSLFLIAVLPFASGLLLTGCPPAHLKVDYGKDGAPTSADEVLKRVELAESLAVSLKGEGKLYVESPQGKGAVTIFVATSMPALIHLEQLDFFGRPQGVLTTDGTRFGLYDAQAGKYLDGPATAQNLGRFLPVVMPPAELTGLLLGRSPRIPADSKTMTFDDTLGVFVVTLTKGSVVQTLHVQPPSYRVVKSTVVGLQAYDLEFGDLTPAGPGYFAKKVLLHAPSAQTKVELTWKDFTLNEPPDLTMFDFEPPEGVPVVKIDGHGMPVSP